MELFISNYFEKCSGENLQNNNSTISFDESVSFFVMSGDELIRKHTLVLQSSTVSLKDLWGSSNETGATSCNDAPAVISIKVEEGTDLYIKVEEIPEAVSFPAIKSEQDEVSYMSLCHQYTKMASFFCDLGLSVHLNNSSVVNVNLFYVNPY